MIEQNEVMKILFENDKSKSWLANKLSITPQKLDYRLSKAKKIAIEDYKEIMRIFKKEGFITSNSEQCTHLLNQTIEIDALLGHALTILNTNVKKFTSDNVLEYREKKRLSEVIDKIRNEFNDELDQIEEIIEGR